MLHGYPIKTINTHRFCNYYSTKIEKYDNEAVGIDNWVKSQKFKAMRNNIEDPTVCFIFIIISFSFSNASCNCSLRIHYWQDIIVSEIKVIRSLFVRRLHQPLQLAIYLSQLEGKTNRIVPLNYICLHSCQKYVYVLVKIELIF